MKSGLGFLINFEDLGVGKKINSTKYMAETIKKNIYEMSSDTHFIITEKKTEPHSSSTEKLGHTEYNLYSAKRIKCKSEKDMRELIPIITGGENYFQ